MSEFMLVMDEGAKFSFLASFSLLIKQFAEGSLVVVWMIQLLEFCVGVRTVIRTASACLLVVSLAFLWLVIYFVWRSPVIKWLMSVNTMIPVMFL